MPAILNLAVTTGSTDQHGNPVRQILTFEFEGGITQYEFSTGSKDEEGYSYKNSTFTIDWWEKVIHRKDFVSSQDCDGKIEFWNSYVMPFTENMVHSAFIHEECWERVGGRQRDYSAEAMNY